MAASAAETLDPPVDIVTLAEDDPKPFILDETAFAGFLDRVKAEVAQVGSDVSTDKNRKAIASAAYKIAKCKTAIDAAGKALNEDARKQIAVIDAARRKIRTELDALKDAVRRPLTEWEEAEKARQAKAQSILDRLTRLTQDPAPIGSTADEIAERIATVEGYELDAETFGEGLPGAEQAKTRALAALRSAHERAVEDEANRAELERLRKEAAEREEREAEEARKREAAQAEERRAEEERKRTEAAAAEAAEKAKREAEEKARAEKQAAEERARDERHRKAVIEAAVDALHDAGLPRHTAQFAIDHIASGHVPRVSVQF